MSDGAKLTRIFTFGYDHRATVNGFDFDQDVAVQITASNPRAVMHENFGDKWSFEYKPGDFRRSFYPRGVVDLNGITVPEPTRAS